MTADTIIATHDLSKHYRETVAVQSLGLDVRRGEIYGFLGRNGAGKTTTIRMMLGLIRPTEGWVEMLGQRVGPDSIDVFARVGYLVESAVAYPNLTIREELEIQRRLTGSSLEALDSAIELLRLQPYRDRQARRLSLGNKQRLSLARALLSRPDILILDEPANALDPAGIVEIRELLRMLADERGVTVFMSSHILAEVAHLADRVGIIDEGRLIQEVDRAQLVENTRRYVRVAVREPELDTALETLRRAGFVDVESRAGELRVFEPEERAPEIARTLVEAGVDLRAMTPEREDLEEYFLRLTGGRF
jgi:ABC-2 type transport system ATP-binding protein